MIHLHGVVRSISQELLPRMLIVALVITLFKTGQVSNKQNPGGWVCQYQEIVFWNLVCGYRSCEWRRPSNAHPLPQIGLPFWRWINQIPEDAHLGPKPVFSIPATSKLKWSWLLGSQEKTRGQSFWWQADILVHFLPEKQSDWALRTSSQSHIHAVNQAHTPGLPGAAKIYTYWTFLFTGMMFPPSSLYQ